MPLDDFQDATQIGQTPPSPTGGVPEGFDPERWRLLSVRMSAPVPALTSVQATELVWQLFRRTPPGDRQLLTSALDFIGAPIEDYYRPTPVEAEDDDAPVFSDDALPKYPGDDRDDEYGWLQPLDPDAERDWWSP